MASTSSTLSLYKNILKQAKLFPSIKRNKIIEEIRISFRENRALTDEMKIKGALEVGYKGLEQLSAYTTLPKNSNNWSVTMDSNPMPKPDR